MTTNPNTNLLESTGFSVAAASPRRGLLSLRGSIFTAGLLLAASVAHAQGVHGPTVIGAGSGSFVGTEASSYLHGAADVIRSQGLYEMYSKQGMIQHEDARSRYIANGERVARNYWAGKEAHGARQVIKRAREKHSPEAVNKAAKSGLPSPLGRAALDPETGRITWPRLLLDGRFAAKRADVNKLFAQRAKSSTTAESLDKIRSATREMVAVLQGNIQKLPVNDYLQARKFLENLEFTATRS